MLIASSGAAAAAAIAVVGAIVIVVLVTMFLKSSLKVVQQGSVGVVKRFGQFRTVQQPGLHLLVPLADRMDKVDIREFPHTGDQQSVITQDNVSLQVSATIFCQVTDVKLALFEINDFNLAIDQMSRTALRAVFGELTLDQSLSQRENINTKMQEHMAEATLKWGVRLNRIEILDITPPVNVLDAMSAAVDTPPSVLRVDGGASVMNLLLQLQADQTGIPVARPRSVETTGLGAAMLAGLAEGLWGSLDELSSLWAEDASFVPAVSTEQADLAHQAWLRALDKSRGWVADL